MKYLVKSRGLIDGTGRPVLEKGEMLVCDGAIEAVGRNLPVEGARILHAEDLFLMPGLVDSHTHLSIVPAEGDQLGQMAYPAAKNVLRALPNIRKQMETGVTTMRIMGEEHFMDLDMKDAINQGLLQGPRLIVSGIGIVASNGHGAAITTSDTEYEVRKNIRKNFHRGADFVKMFISGGMSSARPPIDFCGYTREEIRAAVEEAGRMDSYVAVHAHGGKGVDFAIEEGVRTIEHGALLTDAQLAGIREKGMWVIGTFSIAFHPDGIEKTDFSNPDIKAKVLTNREKIAQTFGKIIAGGIHYAVGTDSMHGLIAYETECLTRFGASNLEAIRAVTLSGAEVCGVADQIGSLEVGKAADFLLVDGDPTEDITAMNNVKLVCKDGVFLVDKRV